MLEIQLRVYEGSQKITRERLDILADSIIMPRGVCQ